MRFTLSAALVPCILLASPIASAHITVTEVDAKPFDPSIKVIAKHWGFNSEAEKAKYLEWLGDKVDHTYATKEEFKTALKAAAAGGGASASRAPAQITLTGAHANWTGTTVQLSEVTNLPDPKKLQAHVAAYIKAVSGDDARHPNIGPLEGANKFKVIGNPETLPSGKVIAHVLNAGQGWAATHEFDSVDGAVEFFRETGAVNRDHEILINAHMKEGSDAVHELMHSYQGSDARWDWYFNEGMTDFFAQDFGATPNGRAYQYKAGRTYTQAVEVVRKVAAVIGKDKLAKLYFGDVDPGPFKAFAKELSMILKQQQMAKDNPGVYTLQLEQGPMANKYKKLGLLGGTTPPPMLSDKEIADASTALKKKMNW